MMISPEAYIENKIDWTLDQLLEEKHKLEKYLDDYNNHKLPKEDYQTFPTPDTIAHWTKEYIDKIEILISLKESDNQHEIGTKTITDFDEIQDLITRNYDFSEAELSKIINKDGWAEIGLFTGNKDYEFHFDNVSEFTIIYFTDDDIIDSIELYKEDDKIHFEVDDIGIYIIAENISVKERVVDREIYTYVSVKFNETDEKTFYYLSKINDLKIGDYVLVNARDKECIAIIDSIRKYDYDNVPYTLGKVKNIIRKATKEEYEKLNKNGTIKVFQSETNSYIEKKIIGKYKYIRNEDTVSLKQGNIYYRVEPENEFRIVDETNEDYLYIPDDFEKVE